MSAESRRERFRAARHDPALCVIEGLHALKHALRFGAEVDEIVIPDRHGLQRLAETLAPDVAGRIVADAVEIPDDEYAALAPLPHPTGVMALARRAAWDAETILAADGPVVFLEDPVHLGNLGACVRVAAAAGAGGLLCSGRHDPWSPESVRSAAGLQYAVPVARLASLPPCPERLVALDAGAPPLAELVADEQLPVDAVFAFGSERRGLSPELRRATALHASLPMRQGVSSLNLATAVAATLYTLRALAAR